MKKEIKEELKKVFTPKKEEKEEKKEVTLDPDLPENRQRWMR